jgi:zinc-ribbon domain
MTASNYCSHCGAPRPDGVRACPFCATVFADAVGTPGPGVVPAGVPPDVLAAIDSGNLIEAIRLYRAARKVGLKEAKDVVEAAARARRR